MTAANNRSLAKAAADMGRKGGLAGTGKAKKRGNVLYYRDMQKKSVQSRLKNKGKGK